MAERSAGGLRCFGVNDMDPYYEWLGIPPEEQPPNHYRLLGISLLESNPQVIESAANQRMGYLQEITGDQNHMDDAQRIIGELSRARLVLLDKIKKNAYDKEICQALDLLPEESPSTTQTHSDSLNTKIDNVKVLRGGNNSSTKNQPPQTTQPQSRNLPTRKDQGQTETDEKRFLSRPRLLVSLAACSLILCTIAVFVLIAGPDNAPESGPPLGEPSAKNAAKPNNQTVKIVKSQPKVAGKTNGSGRRPVPSLSRSPDEVAADPPPPVPAVSSSGIQQNSTKPDEQVSKPDDNPFVIGSKRDPSIASSIMPADSLPVPGDIEDRVRVTIKDNEAQFTFNDEGKRRSISLVGSFNSWNSNATPMRREGRVWKTTKRLSPIRHEFKFVDGNGQWYPEGDNLVLNLGGQPSAVDPPAVSNEADIKPIPVPLEVTGDHQGRVVVTQVGPSIRFAFRNEPPQDYVLLLGDFNSWNATVGAMRREDENWVATKRLPPGNYAFKFLGPDDNWYPAGDNLSIHFHRTIEPNTPPNEAPEQNVQSAEPQPSGLPPRAPDESRDTISNQRAREYLNDAGLYEGKPGVWYFPQNNRLVIRQYGRIAKDPKIKKALKKLGDRLPHPAEMENPPPQRR